MKKLVILIVVAFLIFGCFEQNDQIVGEQNVAVQFMKSANIDVVSAKCIVSADDMDTIGVFLDVSPIMISGEISDVPFGDDRLFEIMCYNSSGNMNYYGSTLVDINSLAPIVDIILYQVDSSADVTIQGTFADTMETEEKIVFSAEYSGKLNLYIMDTDGTNVERLTEFESSDELPHFSPDRQKIAFQRGRTPEEGPKACILDLRSREIIELAFTDSCDAHHICWNAAGTKLIFRSNLTGISDVYEYDLENDTLLPLVVNGHRNWTPNYSPDGEFIILCSDMTGTFRGYIANPDGSNIRMFTSGTYTEERSAKFSPTNPNLIVFSGRGYDDNSSSQFGLFIIDISTGSVSTVISTNGVNEGCPNWSPDGNWLIYEEHDGDRGIYMIRPDGSGKKMILDDAGNERYPHWL
jgi:Tol biopolymer transport system component